MSFILGLLLGLAAGYAGRYLQTNPDKIAELRDLFKRKGKE
jgi:hypothetical protein